MESTNNKDCAEIDQIEDIDIASASSLELLTSQKHLDMARTKGKRKLTTIKNTCSKKHKKYILPDINQIEVEESSSHNEDGKDNEDNEDVVREKTLENLPVTIDYQNHELIEKVKKLIEVDPKIYVCKRCGYPISVEHICSYVKNFKMFSKLKKIDILLKHSSTCFASGQLMEGFFYRYWYFAIADKDKGIPPRRPYYGYLKNTLISSYPVLSPYFSILHDYKAMNKIIENIPDQILKTSLTANYLNFKDLYNQLSNYASNNNNTMSVINLNILYPS